MDLELVAASFWGVHPVFHMSLLWKPDLIDSRQPHPPDTIIIDQNLKWDNWEPVKNLKNCKALVSQFDAWFPNTARKHRQHQRKR
ncbi:hypothetical protein VP01_461g5 [Puccinia sorghi]|uniref:Uncharacterized protein n=1 Tax=Puccinia sorghi TaxID=27349 RepID=A0A0L6UNG0_9BASI|nr:hypothetical protein VP01_461g5 [Puccinia sorghi]